MSTFYSVIELLLLLLHCCCCCCCSAAAAAAASSAAIAVVGYFTKWLRANEWLSDRQRAMCVCCTGTSPMYWKVSSVQRACEYYTPYCRCFKLKFCLFLSRCPLVWKTWKCQGAVAQKRGPVHCWTRYIKHSPYSASLCHYSIREEKWHP